MKLALRSLPLCAASALLLLPACAQKKTAECTAFVQVINGGVVGIERASKNEADPSGISDLKSMADAVDKIASESAALQLTVPELRKLRDDYEKMTRGIAKAERELAAAAAAPDRDAARRTAAEAALEAAVKLEDPLVDQLNKVCSGM